MLSVVCCCPCCPYRLTHTCLGDEELLETLYSQHMGAQKHCAGPQIPESRESVTSSFAGAMKTADGNTLSAASRKRPMHTQGYCAPSHTGRTPEQDQIHALRKQLEQSQAENAETKRQTLVSISIRKRLESKLTEEADARSNAETRADACERLADLATTDAMSKLPSYSVREQSRETLWKNDPATTA